MSRGEIWWADLPAPVGSGPGFRRPALVVQSDRFNRSAIQTVIVVILTSNLALSRAPGNVLVRARDSGLPRDSVVNISQILTVDRGILTSQCGSLDDATMSAVEDGIRLVMSL